MKTTYTAPHGHADVVRLERHELPERLHETYPDPFVVRERRRNGTWMTYEEYYFFEANARSVANSIDAWAHRTYREPVDA